MPCTVIFCFRLVKILIFFYYLLLLPYYCTSKILAEFTQRVKSAGDFEKIKFEGRGASRCATLDSIRCDAMAVRCDCDVLAICDATLLIIAMRCGAIRYDAMRCYAMRFVVNMI